MATKIDDWIDETSLDVEKILICVALASGQDPETTTKTQFYSMCGRLQVKIIDCMGLNICIGVITRASSKQSSYGCVAYV